MDNGVLNSWKEIAAYTGRGVRTVQRWEQELDFPIRRPRGKHRSAVIALKQEIDLWMRSPHGDNLERKAHHIAFETHKRLLNNTQILQTRASVLLSRSEALTRQVASMMALQAAMRASWAISREERKNWAGELSANSHALKKAMVRATGLGVAEQNSTPPAKRIAN